MPFNIMSVRLRDRRGAGTRGMTFVEIMVTVAIFAFVVGAMLVVMLASDTSWRAGQDKLVEQQDARRVMDNVVSMVRQTRPEWITINFAAAPNRDKILFYLPVFDAEGIMSSGPWVIIKPNPENENELIMKRQDIGVWQTIAQNVNAVHFGAGCANCASYTCVTPDITCPFIKVDIQTKEDKGFNLTSCISIRNSGTAVVGGIIPPDAGEF